MNSLKPKNRIVAIDVVRGAALLGILIMNIQAFALPISAYFNPLVYGGFEGWEKLAWYATRLFFDVKFLSIFSMLFGASLVLAGGGRQGKKRLAWLLVFGLLHGYLLFVGDILFTYAVVGFLIFPARLWSSHQQLRLGLALLMIAPLTLLLLGLTYESLPDSWRLELVRTVTDMDLAHELAVFRSNYINQLPLRMELSFSNQVWGTALESGWQAAGCMLLGMAAVQTKFFENAKRFTRVAAVFFLAGLLITAGGIWVNTASAFAPRAWLFGQALHMVGSAGVAFGWVTLLVCLSQAPSLETPFRFVGKLGQVAFSAYIMQSLIGLFVFGGNGLGQYGYWSRTELLVAPFLIWFLQVLLAYAWTSRFRVGPLEALWRGLYRGDFSLGREVD
jgi:uncharacterized protein